MVKNNKTKNTNDPRIGNPISINSIKLDTAIIEQTLESFGITARVVETNYRPKDTEFCLEIALGTPLETITKLHKDIAMALASLTGDVEIEAPIPGRCLVAIRMPYEKQWYETKIKAFKARQKYEKDNPIKTDAAIIDRPEFPKTFRDYLAIVFYIIASILDITVAYLKKLGNFIEGKDRSF